MSSPASVFIRILRSFETGGLRPQDVVAELERLLNRGASAAELSDVLCRRELVQPLPPEVHEEVVAMLDAAHERAAAAVARSEPPDVSVDAGSELAAKSSLPDSRLITTPLDGPAAGAKNALPPQDSSSIVARAIALARRSSAPASISVPPSASVPPPVRRSGKARSAPDDWSDLAISREDLTPEPIAQGGASTRAGVAPRRPAARVIGFIAVALILAVMAWLYARQAPTPAAAARNERSPSPGTLLRDCPLCAPMIVLPAGRFARSFAMSRNLVTVDEYRRFIDATGRDTQGCDTYDGSWNHRPESNWQNPGFVQTGLHPVTCVSWNDAAAYAQWLSAKTGQRYRLPSASEWEYAARAGGEAVYPWASNGSNACAFANVADATAAGRYPGWAAFPCDDGYANTSPVGSFQANPLGLNDMLGNVLQWTQDCWLSDDRGAPVDGSARMDDDCSERELRGGSWFTSPTYVRANYRNHFAADYRTSSVGVRLVREIQP